MDFFLLPSHCHSLLCALVQRWGIERKNRTCRKPGEISPKQPHIHWLIHNYDFIYLINAENNEENHCTTRKRKSHTFCLALSSASVFFYSFCFPFKLFSHLLKKKRSEMQSWMKKKKYSKSSLWEHKDCLFGGTDDHYTVVGDLGPLYLWLPGANQWFAWCLTKKISRRKKSFLGLNNSYAIALLLFLLFSTFFLLSRAYIQIHSKLYSYQFVYLYMLQEEKSSTTCSFSFYILLIFLGSVSVVHHIFLRICPIFFKSKEKHKKQGITTYHFSSGSIDLSLFARWSYRYFIYTIYQ